MKTKLLLLLLAMFAGCVILPPPNTPPAAFEFVEEYPAWNMPEPAIINMWIVPERIEPGEFMEINLIVANLGSGEAPPYQLLITAGEETIEQQTMGVLPALAQEKFSFRWRTRKPGNTNIQAELLLRPDTYDGNLANNRRQAIARVAGEEHPKGELDVHCPFLEGGNAPNAGESIRLPFIFHNPGFAHLDNIPVRFYLDGELWREDRVAYLPPGADQEIVVPWVQVTPGEHMVSLEMELPGIFSDALKEAVKGWAVSIPDLTTLYDVVQKNKWISIGPRILNNQDVGRISCFAYQPNNPNVMYAGGFGGDGGIPAATGVWKTTNGGQSWAPVGDKLASLEISAMAVDPLYPDHVYAGTPSFGIFKSMDGGKSWDLFASQIITGAWISELFVRSEAAPSSPQTVIYMATADGVYRYTSNMPQAKTSTAGQWVRIKTGKVTDLALHPTKRSLVYASIEDQGLFRTDQGLTATAEISTGKHDWTKLDQGLPAIKGWHGLMIDIYRSDPAYIYAGVAKPRTGIQFAIYRSTNGGDQFGPPLVEYPDNTLDGLYNPYIRVNATRPDMVYFGGVHLYKWSAYNTPAGKSSATYRISGSRADMKAMEFHPTQQDVLYMACDQGVFRILSAQKPKSYPTQNDPLGTAGDQVYPCNNDLRVTELYDFDISTQGSLKILGGTQDVGNILYEGNQTWRFIPIYNYGDGFFSLITPSNGQVMYAQFQSLNSTARSGDGGKTWQKIAENKGLPVGLAAKGRITADPNYPNTLLAISLGNSGTTGEVYETKDAHLGGNCTWNTCGPKGPTVKGKISEVRIQPSTTHWFAATEKGQIWTTSAKIQSTWSLIDVHPDGASVHNMVFSPADPHVLYVLYAGGDAYRRIERLEYYPGGGWNGTWITDNFPLNQDPLVICGDGYCPDVAYIGTRHGVYRWDGSQPTYQSWQPYNDGFPLTSVTDLQVGPDKKLYAATKGRGAWVVITGP